ncbi:MAG: L,D-transpeptidase family protein [Acidobacteria bacterium]|nr:L,D-transpeptidase family protein [Acidobacteriota bacterium]
MIWMLLLLGPGEISPLAESLRNRVENALANGIYDCGDEQLMHGSHLTDFYMTHDFEPRWMEIDQPKDKFHQLIDCLKKASDHGLDPNDYHVHQLSSFLEAFAKGPSARLAVDMELLASDAFLSYASHLVSGSVDPKTLDPEWHIERSEQDPRMLLQQLEGNLSRLFEGLAPQSPQYRRLQKALKLWQSRQVEGHWDQLESGPIIKPGGKHPQVALIKRRFAVTPETENYDEPLISIIKDFQKRHYLEADGKIGDQTRAVLNLTPAMKVAQIKANLERWRWLPRTFAETHIDINIAGFDLKVIDRNETVLAMDVIVGRPFRQTPVFTATMRYLVLSPYWHVPPMLANQDKLPDFKQDPQKLIDLGFRVFDGWGVHATELDPMSINWKAMKTSMPYRLRQDPGPQNALGQVKFMFPNEYNVYLHDTPARELFKKAQRGLSSGCIRVSEPMRLAQYLLQDQPEWTPERIDSVIAARQETTITLTRPIQVLLLYWTVLVQDEEVYFLQDLYGRDQILIESLKKVTSQIEDQP